MVDGGRVGLAPGGPGSLLCSSLLGWRDKLALARVLNGVGSLDPGSLGSISVGEWVSGLSSRTRVRDIVHTVVRLATYVNAPGTLSAEVASMQLRMALGSGVIYLDRGWQQLVESLGNAPGVRLSRGDHIDELPDAPCVIVATGAPRSAGALIGAHFDVGPGAEVAVLDVALRRPPGRDVVLGIDPPVYLSNHGFPAGMTPAGASSVSVAEYLASDTAPDRDRLRRFLTHAGITPDAVVAERYLHRMLAVSAIATAESGGLSGRPTGTVADHPGVYVVGDWVGARGHLLDAVLASAQDAARQAIAHLDRRPVSR